MHLVPPDDTRMEVCPLEFAPCTEMTSLSAVVGMFVAVALFPLPGYITDILRQAQKSRMKEVGEESVLRCAALTCLVLL